MVHYGDRDQLLEPISATYYNSAVLFSRDKNEDPYSFYIESKIEQKNKNGFLL